MIKWCVLTPAGDMVGLTPQATRQLAVQTAVSIWKRSWAELVNDGFRCGRIELANPEIVFVNVPLPGHDLDYLRAKAVQHGLDFTNFLSLVMANGVRMLREENGDA